jgi:hypothetical protein
LRDRVKELKKTSEGEGTMCAVMEERIKEDRLENAEKMIALGTYPLEEIAFIQNLPFSDVQKLAEEMKKHPKAE